MRSLMPHPKTNPPANQPRQADRGKYGGTCERTCCQAPGWAFCRHRDGTGRHYCLYCAKEINRVNRDDSMRIFGHPDIIEIPENIRELMENA